MNKDSIGVLYDLFADLMSYPTSELFSQANICMQKLRPIHHQAATALEQFSAALMELNLAQIEELYTVNFDMQPVCYPYAGYHLFGESYKRGAFMAQLNEAYNAFGFSCGDELPDYVPTILRFLALDSINRQGDFCQALTNEGLLPALVKMSLAFGDQSENPYASLLAALHLYFSQTPIKELDHA